MFQHFIRIGKENQIFDILAGRIRLRSGIQDPGFIELSGPGAIESAIKPVLSDSRRDRSVHGNANVPRSIEAKLHGGDMVEPVMLDVDSIRMVSDSRACCRIERKSKGLASRNTESLDLIIPVTPNVPLMASVGLVDKTSPIGRRKTQYCTERKRWYLTWVASTLCQ